MVVFGCERHGLLRPWPSAVRLNPALPYSFTAGALVNLPMTAEDICVLGVGNNTCAFACDGRCDDNTYPCTC